MSEISAKFKADKINFFKFYIQLLNPLLKLTTREQEVLAAMLLLWFSNKENPNIDTLLFSTGTRKVLREALKLSEPSLNNSFSILRKKGLIEDNQIKKSLLNFPVLEEGNKITIKYELQLVE